MGIKIKLNKAELRLKGFISHLIVAACNYKASLKPISGSNTVSIGNAIAHDPMWHLPITDGRGLDLAAEVVDSGFGGTPTGIQTTKLRKPTSSGLDDLIVTSYGNREK